MSSHKYYTRAIVAEKLGISESTVYKYARENKIRAVPNPNKMRSQIVYYAKEVDELAAARESLINSKCELSITDLANELGLKRQQVSYLISSNQLEVNRIRINNQTHISVPADTVEQVKAIYEESLLTSEKYKRQQYYNEELNLLLLQPFEDPNGMIYRVDVRNGIWGFYSIQSGFLTAEQLQTDETLNLKALYSIQSTRAPKDQSYLTLHFNKSEIKQSKLLAIFDYFVFILGLDFIKLHVSGQVFEISIAQSIVDLELYPFPEQIELLDLQNAVIEGELNLVGAELFIIGSTQRFAFDVKRNALAALEDEAAATNQKMGDLLNTILSDRYKL